MSADSDDLSARVLAAPDAAGRAALLGVDLDRLAASRNRMVGVGTAITALLAAVIVGLPLVRLAQQQVTPDALVAFAREHLYYATIGLAAALIAMSVAMQAFRVIGRRLTRHPELVIVFAAVIIPFVFFVVSLITRVQASILIGLVAGAAVSMQIGIVTSVPNYARMLRENRPGAAEAITFGHTLPPIQNIVGGPVRWLLVETTSNVVGFTSSVLLFSVHWWMVAPVIAVEYLVRRFGVEPLKSARRYRAAVAVSAAVAVIWVVLAILIASAPLWPTVRFTGGGVPV